jgi:hypothetical protein
VAGPAATARVIVTDWSGLIRHSGCTPSAPVNSSGNGNMIAIVRF